MRSRDVWGGVAEVAESGLEGGLRQLRVRKSRSILELLDPIEEDENAQIELTEDRIYGRGQKAEGQIYAGPSRNVVRCREVHEHRKD